MGEPRQGEARHDEARRGELKPGGDPLYVRLADTLAAEIRDKGLAPGDPLPSQSELIERFGVSLATVRQALHRLTRSGLIVSRHGKGLFVAEPRVEAGVATLAFSGPGEPALSRTLVETLLTAPSDEVRAALGIRPGADIAKGRYRLTRHGAVIGLEVRNVPLAVLAKIERPFPPDGVFEPWFAHGGPETTPVRASGSLRAEPATAFDATFLGIEEGTVVLHQYMTLFAAGGAPISAGRITVVAEDVDLRFELTLGGAA